MNYCILKRLILSLLPFLKQVDEWQSSVSSESTGSNFNPRGCLAAFIFTSVDKPGDFLNNIFVVTQVNNLLYGFIIFYIRIQDWIKDVVWRKAICVFLFRS